MHIIVRLPTILFSNSIHHFQASLCQFCKKISMLLHRKSIRFVILTDCSVKPRLKQKIVSGIATESLQKQCLFGSKLELTRNIRISIWYTTTYCKTWSDYKWGYLIGKSESPRRAVFQETRYCSYKNELN